MMTAILHGQGGWQRATAKLCNRLASNRPSRQSPMSQAEPQFLAAAAPFFNVKTVPSEDLDEVYQCADVDVLLLTLKPAKDGGALTGRGGC